MHRILLLLTILFPVFLSAQYERGSWYVDARSHHVSKQQNTRLPGNERNGSSRSGYFLIDRLLVGVNPFEGQAYARYYVPLGAESKTAAFGELAVGGFYSRNYTRWQPAIGLERQLAPGLFASALLRRTFDGDRRNFNTLEINLNGVAGRGFRIGGSPIVSERGTIFIDPSIAEIDFLFPEEDNVRSLGFRLNVSGGVFLSDRWAVEGGVSLENGKTEFTDFDGSYDRTDFASYLGMRYQFISDRRFRPFAGAGIEFRRSKIDYRYGSPNRPDLFSDRNQFSPYLKAGFDYFVNERVAVELAGQVNFVDTDIQFLDTYRFGLGAGLKVFIGR